MAPPKRPSAFDLSFPEDAAENLSAGSTDLQNQITPGSRTSLLVSQQRKGQDYAQAKLSAPNLSYIPSINEIHEGPDLKILGEDLDMTPAGQNKKPVRLLSNFCIFDLHLGLEYTSLDMLSSTYISLGAAGLVAAVYENDEDAGQEDDMSFDQYLQHIRTSPILHFCIDYTKLEPVYLETKFSWLRLGMPVQDYAEQWYSFYKPHRIMQHLLASACMDPSWPCQDFLDTILGSFDSTLQSAITIQDIQRVLPLLPTALGDLGEQGQSLRRGGLIQSLLQLQGDLSLSRSSSVLSHHWASPSLANLGGNPDISLLRAENQSVTCATPLISQLACGLFPDHIAVVGPRLQPLDKIAQKRSKSMAYQYLAGLLEKVLLPRTVEFQRRWRIPTSDYSSALLMNNMKYKIGDIVIIQAGSYKSQAAPALPLDTDLLPVDATAADFFWFGKIVSINHADQMLHLHFFWSASKTILHELAEPQELFLSQTCSSISAQAIISKAIVHLNYSGASLPANEFFCNFTYQDTDGSFLAIDSYLSDNIHSLSPPHNCSVCVAAAQQDQDLYCQSIAKGKGIAYRGEVYHLHDYILVATQDGPASIAQILSIKFSSRAQDHGHATLIVRCLGRISAVHQLPSEILKDDRHLFLTDDTVQIAYTSLLQKCFIIHNSFYKGNFDKWLALSPYHFYITYAFPSLSAATWTHPPQTFSALPYCQVCYDDMQSMSQDIKHFQSSIHRHPLRTFDPFAGVGAFVQGLEDSHCLKLTHAIEISPSAAETLRYNLAEQGNTAQVYNQCANTMLSYAIKFKHNHEIKVPRDLMTKQPVGPPPQPGQIDCIVAGFPCQPHSRLNQFQKANDRKSYLILNLLSWIDFLQPKVIFLENVRGFLSYSLSASQTNQYRVHGGIKMGGLKFVIRALLTMGYQVRYGLLQAAHYGTPQSRVRFFLVASQKTYPLPELPQPTHFFPLKDELPIPLDDGDKLMPIPPVQGRAPYPFVTIDAAIGDLPQFDWEDPTKLRASNRLPSTQNRLRIKCDKTKAFTGLSGPIGPELRYGTEPQTLFQAECRKKDTRDLQHYTRVFKEETVERVVNIPLEAKADYRTLDHSLWEWQFANASSATARDSFKPGMYGRLDAQGWFHTTVTNVDPTAKQSYVLHPHCRRVVTVRELARSQGFPDSFVFKTHDENVKTMQRQIGNAVPIPVGQALGRELRTALFKKWRKDQERKRSAELIE